MRGMSRRAAPELPRRQRIDGLAGRSWMLPRAKKPARAKRKIGGRAGTANGTAGQTQAFSQANPLGSVGFGELLVRTAECETVPKNRQGSNNETPSPQGLQQRCPGEMDASRSHSGGTRTLQNHPGCKGCKGRTLREVEGLLE